MSAPTDKSARGAFDENYVPRLRILNGSGVGYKTEIYIDGQDVSGCFNRVEITCDLNGTVSATLTATVCEVTAGGDMTQLVMPDARTADLLVSYGWTPPAEPVVVEHSRVRASVVEPLDNELFTHGEAVTGRDLLNKFISRLQSEWAPNEDDTLTVSRVRDLDNVPIPGKREYTLSVTLDAPTAELPCTCGHPIGDHLWTADAQPAACHNEAHDGELGGYYGGCMCGRYEAGETNE